MDLNNLFLYHILISRKFYKIIQFSLFLFISSVLGKLEIFVIESLKNLVWKDKHKNIPLPRSFGRGMIWL